VILISKERVQLHDIRMIQKTLNLYLSNELIDELLLTFEDTLGDLLQGTYKIRGLVPGYSKGYLTR